MNKEVLKAMNKKEKKTSAISKWYQKNYAKIWKTILFPLYFAELSIEKYNKWKDSKNKWDEERAKEILSYYIPRRFKWIEKDKCFYVFDNGIGWGSAKKYLKRKDRRFWKLHTSWFGGDVRYYLIEKFELEGFEKVVENCSDGWTEMTFKLIEK